MKLYRVLISSITSSFRYPNMMSSHQLSIKAVPYTTIQGLIGSASGNTDMKGVKLSYVFRYESSFFDVETIYKIQKEKNKAGVFGFKYDAKSKDKQYLAQDGLYPTTAPFNREILYQTYLTLYFVDKKIADSFKSPTFQLLLGRSSDLAKVEEVKEIEVNAIDNIQLNGTILPFNQYKMAGEIYTMPTYFDYTNNIRDSIGVQPFVILSGEGKFLTSSSTKLQKFDLNNWKFVKFANEYKSKGDTFFDDELNTPILLRDFGC
ncbi:type I-B CRISPR-associated protein Cas5b [Aliarcobacter butzleri]